MQNGAVTAAQFCNPFTAVIYSLNKKREGRMGSHMLCAQQSIFLRSLVTVVNFLQRWPQIEKYIEEEKK